MYKRITSFTALYLISLGIATDFTLYDSVIERLRKFQSNMRNVMIVYNAKENPGDFLIAHAFKRFAVRGILVLATDGNNRLLLYEQVILSHYQDNKIVFLDNTDSSNIWNDIPQEAISRGTWYFLWLKAQPLLEDEVRSLLDGVFIPYKSRVYIVTTDQILEVYQVSRIHPLTVQLLGNEGVIWERRRNLHGENIRTVLVQSLHERTEAIHNKERMSLNFHMIWRNLEQILNFSTHLITVPNSPATVQVTNASWDKSVTKVMLGEADITLLGLPTVSSSAQLVDFTTSLYQMSFSILVAERSEDSTDWGYLLRLYEIPLWLELAAIVVGLTLVLAWTSRMSDVFIQRKKEFLHTQLSEALQMTLSAICQQGYPKSPPTLSTRGTLVVVFLLGTMLNALYSSSIVSNLAVGKEEPPFQSLSELMLSTQYQLVVTEGSSAAIILRDTRDHLVQSYHNNRGIKIVKNLEEALTEICKNSARGPLNNFRQSALFVPSSWVASVSRVSKCSLMEIPSDYFHFWTALPLIKGFPYRQVLNHYMYKVREGGLLHRLSATNDLQSTVDDDEAVLPSVTLRDVASIFIMLLAGTAIALIELFGELLVQHFNKTKLNGRKIIIHPVPRYSIR